MSTTVVRTSIRGSGLGALSIVLGIDLATAQQLVGRRCEESFARPDGAGTVMLGLTPAELLSALFRSHLTAIFVTHPAHLAPDDIHRTAYDELGLMRWQDCVEHMDAGGRCILAVDTGESDFFHCVVTEGYRVYDPITPPRFTSFDSLKGRVIYAILIGGAPARTDRLGRSRATAR